MVWACTTASGISSLVFTEDVTADRSNMTRCIRLHSHFQLNTVKPTGLDFTAQMDNEH